MNASSASKKSLTGQTVGYVRVSTAGQNDARQLDGVNVDRIFADTASGKDTNRPKLKQMLEYVREGDCVVVHSMDRLARSLRDLEEIVTGLNSRGVTISFLSQGLTFTGLDSPMNTLMLQMLGAVSQFERALILERQREGIAIAKAKGNVYKGRKPSVDKSRLPELKRLIEEGVPKSEVAARYGISRTTLYGYLNRSN